MAKRLGNERLLNASFGQKVLQGSKRPRDLFPRERQSARWLVLALFLVVFFLLGLGRLVELQLIKGSYYRLLAEGNRIRRIPLKAPRGEILARDGTPLARNIPIYKLATFSAGGVVEKTQIISREEAFRIQAEGGEEANRLLIDTAREYPLASAAAHVIGYVNETSPDEIGRPLGCDESKITLPTTHNLTFELGDLVGRIGIEAEYDCTLRGVNGEELIETDSRGRLVRKLGRREAIPGKSIILTLDPKLQEIAYNSLLDAPSEKGIGPRRESGEIVRGALVAQNPQNGEILALVSTPSFDPNTISQSYSQTSQDKNLPFFNRAVSGAYHPGSTFKIVVSTAGVESGQIDANFTFDDPGQVLLGQTTFRNWLYVKYGRREGVIGLVRAIARSTDTFFYKVGEMVGVKALDEWASAFNLGHSTGIDLPSEASGLVPSPEWKESVRGERWFLGNTYNMSIGQGDLTATPLQINSVASTIANDGKWCKPHLLREVPQESRVAPADAKAMVGKRVAREECRSLGLKSETLQLIEAGMIGACSPGGTAATFFNFTAPGLPADRRVACKTGTAQFTSEKTHAWFTAFAPSSAEATEGKPEIVATALVEEGGEGSIVAAPVVKKVLEEWFKK